MYHVLVAVDNCHEDVIHRSLQGTYPEYFVKPHDRSLQDNSFCLDFN